jgi:hypothetical protein
MNIEPTAGIGGAYVIDPKTGDRVPAEQDARPEQAVIFDSDDDDEPLDPLAA